MEHRYSLENFHLNSSSVTIGSFDGVHVGHQLILEQVVRHAQAAGIPSVVITFFPHPAVVLHGIKAPYYITMPEQRAQLLSKSGIDYVITMHFDIQLSRLSAYEFMKQLNSHLNLRYLCIGSDFSMGRDRNGNIERLAEIARNLGFQLDEFSSLENGDEKISSSRIRKLMNDGFIDKVNFFLGRRFSIPILGVKSNLIKRPQGKLFLSDLELPVMQLTPGAGIYATRLQLDLDLIPSITHITAQERHRNCYRLSVFSQDRIGTVKDTSETYLEFCGRLRPKKDIDLQKEQYFPENEDFHTAREVISHAG